MSGDWLYSDSTILEAKCSDNGDDMDIAELGSACCSDGVSVCGVALEWPTCVADCTADCLQDGNLACLDDCSASDNATACSQCLDLGFDMSVLGEGVCVAEVGACFRGDSTVQVKTTSSERSLRMETTSTKPLTELKVGDLVATASHDGHNKKEWSKVVGVPHSKSTADFIEVTMADNQGHVVAVTEHHTFPTCHHGHKSAAPAAVPAHMVQAGSCLLTTAGPRKVAKVERRLAAPTDQTFTVELEGAHDLLVLNGVVTHARPQDAKAAARDPKVSKAKAAVAAMVHSHKAATPLVKKRLVKAGAAKAAAMSSKD
mmetsp:Transcript_59007/g.118468  ORF Transcript_59007/g.118468 Transcript_59007/m.118468 type:complete len:315 (-) Transcript_59007:338-1282(-)